MMEVGFKVIGAATLVRQLARISPSARDAHTAALTGAMFEGRRQARDGIAGHYGIPVSVLKSRISGYLFNERGLAAAWLWAGVRNSPRANEHPQVARQIANHNPNAFWATMKSGHRSMMERKQPTRPFGPGARRHPRERGALPIRHARLPNYRSIAEQMLKRAARKVFRRVYLPALVKGFRRRAAKRLRAIAAR